MDSKPKRRLDYNRLADTQQLSGWGFERLVRSLVDDASKEYLLCECVDQLTCIHAAAATLYGIICMVEHDPDCKECADIAKREGGADGL